jgi:hypothetical protein
VLFGTFAGWLKLMPKLMQWAHRVEQLSGGLMIAIGLYFLWIA